MSLRATFGYPIGAAAVVVGALRQTQRWLPRYEWVGAHQLSYYTAAINLTALAVGAFGVFALGVWADRESAHRWQLSTAVGTAVVAAVAGFAVGTAVTIAAQPGHNTISTSLVGFVGPLAVYTVGQGVPIGLAGLAGLTASRIHAIERAEAAVASTASSPDSSDPETETRASPRQPGAADAEQPPFDR